MERKVLNSGLSLWALRCFCDVQWRWSRSSPRIWVKVPAPDTFQILTGTLIFLAFQLILATTSFSFPQNCENHKQTNIKTSNLGQGHTSVRNRIQIPRPPQNVRRVWWPICNSSSRRWRWGSRASWPARLDVCEFWV